MVAHGHLDVLKWARSNECEWSRYTCAHAAHGGHLDVLQWARAHGCEWDKKTCTQAALGGHLEALQWARANGCEWDRKTFSNVEKEEHFHVLDWCREWCGEHGVDEPKPSYTDCSDDASSDDGASDIDT